VNTHDRTNRYFSESNLRDLRNFLRLLTLISSAARCHKIAIMLSIPPDARALPSIPRKKNYNEIIARIISSAVKTITIKLKSASKNFTVWSP
jgi:hypothetical protein